MSKSPPDRTTPAEQSIEELRQRYEKLHRRKIQAETQRDEAMKRLDVLKSEARAKYGTDDLDTLQQKLQTMIRENSEKRSQYQNDLGSIEASLDDVERKFSAMSSMPTDGGATRR